MAKRGPKRQRFAPDPVSGIGHEVTSGPQAYQPYGWRDPVPSASGHAWIATGMWGLSDEAARLGMTPGNRVLLDAENMLGLMVGCYACEQSWSDAVASSPCTGMIPAGEPS